MQTVVAAFSQRTVNPHLYFNHLHVGFCGGNGRAIGVEKDDKAEAMNQSSVPYCVLRPLQKRPATHLGSHL